VLQVQKEKKEQVGFRIEDIKTEYTTLAETIAKTNTKIMSLSDEVSRQLDYQEWHPYLHRPVFSLLWPPGEQVGLFDCYN
jgi:hypothetical protein